MKKYLGLFIVLIMAVMVNIPARAEDTASSNMEVGATTSNILTPEQKRINAETRMKTQADLKLKREGVRTEIKDKREGIKMEIQDKRETMQAEIKEKREEEKKEIKA